MRSPAARSSGVVTGFRVASAGPCAAITTDHSIRAIDTRRMEWTRSISSVADCLRLASKPIVAGSAISAAPAHIPYAVSVVRTTQQFPWKPRLAQKRSLLYRLLLYLLAAMLGLYALAALGLMTL